MGHNAIGAIAIGSRIKVGTDGALRSKFDFVGDSGYTYGKFRTNVDGGDSIGIGNDIKLLARRAVAIGKNVNLTRSATHGVAIGLETAVSQYGGIALGYAAEADRAKGMAGWDPVTGRASTNTGSASKATSAAVSIGRKRTALTRQITGVAAGTADTDAVNVAQLKQAVAKFSGRSAAPKMRMMAPMAVAYAAPLKAGGMGESDGMGTGIDTYAIGGTYDAENKKIDIIQNDASKNYNIDMSGLKDENVYTTDGTYDASTKTLNFTQTDTDKNYSVDVSGLVGSGIGNDAGGRKNHKRGRR